MNHSDPVIGRYLHIEVDGRAYRVYYEEAGCGIPLLCLHTAGADSRQYEHLLRDESLLSQFRMIAFDLPYHGRTFPPDGWWLKPYQLTKDWYVAVIIAVVEALGLADVVLLGCSMGGNIALEMAYRYSDILRAVIALEASAKTPGRLNEYLWHPHVNGGEVAATNVYGLMAPQSSETLKRQAWWIYSQGAPGVYYGDISFYSQGWDATTYISNIDTEQCAVYMLTGEYDYSCTPAMSRSTASLIPGAVFYEMKSIGHFPMCENPKLLVEYLQPVITAICHDTPPSSE
jgi:pimeloyl-ACP methyl ester carboxylesterase